MENANRGYERLFGDDGLTVGATFPLTSARTTRPNVGRELALTERLEALGFDGLWARDVPTDWPKFDDTGQTFDPWTWLSRVAARTDDVALGTASVVLTLRHPLHVAKQAASLDHLSEGRLVLGVASGDRPPEYEAFGVAEDERGAAFRESVEVLRAAWRDAHPEVETRWGTLDGTLDVVPKPTAGDLPLLVTGNSRQSREWIAAHGDGWLFYHLPEDALRSYLDDWNERTAAPFVTTCTVDLAGDPEADPEHVNQGFRAGAAWFRDYFRELDAWGVDHVIVGVRGDDRERAYERVAERVLDRL
ncbi:TIGR03571 family LLM class oxidoreductase [Halarchaeum nitratireducens]|uniref:N5,N10-methylene tetrahydromethanopterin reductase n=1 Tax=Halarchaeum nitratireducens TaxID=489913 RepID=A0A830G9T9_9EURY|nr:TIGR03571 family LLM class oxidoreductase [Halarchaeum nitratireducens]GGN10834.1 N5,N10-methylene tetrahydromethanopterin reductase [Halarchaeum nitratireducens]